MDRMMSYNRARVHREMEFYDGKQFGRQSFDRALTYLNDGVGRQRRNEVIGGAMRDAAGMRVLEIGSQSWE